MTLLIRPLADNDIEALVRLSLLAWAPVFESFEQVLGREIYSIVYPDWQKQQAEGVEGVLRDREKYSTWVGEKDAQVIGFIAYTLNLKEKTGDVDLLAVHPDYQNHGIGTDLNNFALEKMKASGMKLAVVATGGDPGHAPARRSYEKAGYTPLPLVRYYKAL
jgi:GNAT superfamily N-acetyltransferase